MKPCARVLVKMKLLYLAEGLGRVGAHHRRAASLRGVRSNVLREVCFLRCGNDVLVCKSVATVFVS